jgi:hypothetical protein
MNERQGSKLIHLCDSVCLQNAVLATVIQQDHCPASLIIISVINRKDQGAPSPVPKLTYLLVPSHPSSNCSALSTTPALRFMWKNTLPMIDCPVALGSNLLNCNKNWLHSYYKEEAIHSCTGFFFTPRVECMIICQLFKPPFPRNFFFFKYLLWIAYSLTLIFPRRN